MNADMIGGIIRALFPPLFAFLAAKGTLPAGDYGAVITALVALVTAAWSVKTNQSGKTIS